ncbi:TPA: hypothetical protein ACH3X1_016172 [Trebouxia sp. C0004]
MGESSNPIETLTPQTQEKRYNTAPYCVSSMDSAASEPQVDLTVGADDVVDGPATSKGHRGLDDIWDHFKKIKLDSNAAKSLHRNYDATCKGCAERVVGKPEKMRRHLEPMQPQLVDHATVVNTADSMELCSTAELIELFEGYTAADVKQKEDDYFVSETSCTVDLDFNHPAIDESLVASAAVSTTPLARAELGDSNEDYDLSSLVSPS